MDLTGTGPPVARIEIGIGDWESLGVVGSVTENDGDRDMDQTNPRKRERRLACKSQPE